MTPIRKVTYQAGRIAVLLTQDGDTYEAVLRVDGSDVLRKSYGDHESAQRAWSSLTFRAMRMAGSRVLPAKGES